MLRIGTALCDITPQEPMHLGGYLPSREWVGVHDPLSVRALAVSDDTTRLVLLAVDSVGILQPDADRIRTGLAAAAGLPTACIHVAATHSHSTPDIVGLYGGAPATYHNFLVDGAIDAGLAALQRLTPARMRCAQTDVAGVCMNRRVPPGPADAECTILQFGAPDGAILATLTNLSVHAVVLGPDNQLVSADFVHYLREDVEVALGGMALHVNGTEGNMNPAPQLHPDDRLDRTGGTFEEAAMMGRSIARTVVAAIEQAEWVSEVSLDARTTPCAMPLDNPMFVQAIEAGMLPGRIQDGCTEVELGYLRIGPVRLVLLPGEAFAEIGLAIKNWWPEEPVAAIGLCNGLVGYLIPPAVYTEGEYEESVCPSPRAWPALEHALRRLTRPAGVTA